MRWALTRASAGDFSKPPGSYADCVDHAQEFLSEVDAFGELIFDADPKAPVPTCPGWTISHLFRHVGRGNRWAAQIVSDRLADPLDPGTVRDGRPPEDVGGARQWLHDGGRLLLDGVAATGPDTPVWTFTGPKPAAWWVRRRLHEVVVHRADAAIAVGADFSVAPTVAADTLSEWFDLAVARMPDLGGKAVHLHATDAGLGTAGEWMITGGAWSHEHGKGDVAVRGPVADLLLVTTRRAAPADTAVQIFGAESVLQTWLDGMRF